MTTGLIHLIYNRNGEFVGNPTAGIREYYHEHMEGPYIAEFVLESGEGGVDDEGLRAWFTNRLMWQLATEYEGTEVWRGYIWEMELEMGGEVRTKSMHDAANAVKTRYTNSSGDVVHTGWYTHEESILEYGVKERIVTSSSESLEEAQERAQVELQYSGSPYPYINRLPGNGKTPADGNVCRAHGGS